MKPTTRKVVIAIVVALALITLYGVNKAKALMAIFDKMTITPAGISKVNVGLSNISFNIDIKLTNPTAQDFSVDGYGIAELKEISIYYNGIYIATSTVNMTQISVPSDNELILHNIPVNVPNVLDFVQNNLAMVYGMITDFNSLDLSKVTTTGKLSVAGYTIAI